MLPLLAMLAVQPQSIDRLAWLAGCWESVSADRIVEEQWMAPRGHTMLGMGRTLRGGKLVEHELVVVREEGERLAYEAHPSGQSSAVFLSRELGESRVVFENATHDFPQRVGYERKGAGLLAWIEGARDGKVKRIEFPYRRVACP
jgi:hypothetical protein